MKAGRLRERIIFQRRSSRVNELGEQKDKWSDLVSVMASVDPSEGRREFLAAQQVQSELSTHVVCRYSNALAEVKAQDRIFHVRKNLYYDIRSIPIDVDSRGRELQFMCTQRNTL